MRELTFSDEQLVETALAGVYRRQLDRYPQLRRIHLTDYRVRVLEGSGQTDAVVRVLIESTDGDDTWSTIGVSENVIEASWRALADSFVYGLLHATS